MERRINKLILIILLLFDIVFASETTLKSKNYILYNMNDNTIIDEKDSHKEVNIASLTKIMTVLIAIENIDNYSEKITITNNVFSDITWDIHTTGFKVGEKVTYDDLLHAAILDSGADAVNALAINSCGSMKNFIKKMNQKVKDLGLNNTEFDNVIGKDSSHNYSSAYDLAQILMHALKNEKFKSVFSTKKYTLSNGKTVKRSVAQYTSKDISYITGAKTGYYDDALYCLATTATLSDVDYLFVSLGAYPKGEHLADHIKEYNYFDTNYSYKTLVEDDTPIVKLKTKYAKEEEIELFAGTTIKKYLKNDFDKDEIEYTYSGLDVIVYNLKKGTKIGNVKINYKGEELDNFDLIYNGTLTFSLWSFLWINKVFVLIAIVILLLFIRILYVRKTRKIRRMRKKIRKTI